MTIIDHARARPRRRAPASAVPVLWAALVLVAGLLFLAGAPATAAGALPRVRIETSLGPVVIEVETRRAPITATNFLRYVDEKRFDNTTFYRAARSTRYPDRGLVQGGIDRRLVRARLPIPHEPTSRTGLRHIDGTVSMARNAPGTATGNFFVTLGPAPSLDARGAYAGYAAFGRVVQGMAVLRSILSRPTYAGGYSAETKGQTLIKPIRILSARRVR